MNPEELYCVGVAAAKAVETVSDALDVATIEPPPDGDMLAAVEDDDEAETVIARWLASAELEVERVRQLGAAEMQRRRNARW